MADVLAVHGAFRGGWSWDRVRPLLESAGHRVFAPDLTGMGSGVNARGELTDVTLSHWIDDLVAIVESERLRGIVLVGHSMGGVVCQAALGALGDRVDRLVLIDAPLVTEGQTAIAASGPPSATEAGLPPRTTWVPPTPVGVDQGFEDPDLAAWVNSRLCATPLGPQLDPCPPMPAASIPTKLVFCDRTPKGYPATFERARCDANGVGYSLIDANHDVPLLDPEAVADVIFADV